jgi:hypothetical protein
MSAFWKEPLREFLKTTYGCGRIFPSPWVLGTTGKTTSTTLLVNGSGLKLKPLTFLRAFHPPLQKPCLEGAGGGYAEKPCSAVEEESSAAAQHCLSLGRRAYAKLIRGARL